MWSRKNENCALSWWLTQVYTMMHGPKNVKLCQLTVNIQIIRTYPARLCWEKVFLFQNVLGGCVHQADFLRIPALDACVMVRMYIRWDPWHVQYCGLHCIIWWLNQDSNPSVTLRHLLWLALRVASSVLGLDCRLLSNHHELSHRSFYQYFCFYVYMFYRTVFVLIQSK